MTAKKKVWVYRHGPKESGPSKNVIALSMTLSKEGREVMSEIAAQFLADNGKPQMTGGQYYKVAKIN